MGKFSYEHELRWTCKCQVKVVTQVTKSSSQQQAIDLLWRIRFQCSIGQLFFKEKRHPLQPWNEGAHCGRGLCRCVWIHVCELSIGILVTQHLNQSYFFARGKSGFAVCSSSAQCNVTKPHTPIPTFLPSKTQTNSEWPKFWPFISFLTTL